MNIVNTEKRGVIIPLTLLSLFAVTTALTGFLPRDVDAAAVHMNVTILGLRPSVSGIVCCFKDSDEDPDHWECENPEGSYVMTGGEPYDMVCNFTVTDDNGWQDMVDGWVNVTWYNANAGGGWGKGEDGDYQYANASCRNVTGTGSGNSIMFECAVSEIGYWADAGRWLLLVNLSDGSEAGTPGKANFTIVNVTSIWESASINFGSMLPGANGSQWRGGYVNVSAASNNTGNTAINIEVAGGGDMSCGIGTIPVGNIGYDVDLGTSMEFACGQLTAGSDWDSDCSLFDLGDCSDDCDTLPLDYTYWGVTIPSSGVGGTCSLTLTVSGVQAYP